jgi:hypothetical protein
MAARDSGIAGQLGAFLVASISLTPAQILNLFTTPVTIIPAPGPGLSIVPLFVVQQYDFGGIAYGNLGNILQLAIGSILTTLQQIASPATSNQYSVKTSGNFSNMNAQTVNQPAVLQYTVSNYTLGNGSLTITVYYLIVPTGL